jgi:hypothetical protein
VRCEALVLVLPSTLYGFAPPELDPDVLAQASGTGTTDAALYAVADDVGMWTCPACGTSSVLPVA